MAERFLKAYHESLDFYVKNPDKAVALISQYTGVNKDVIAEAWKHGIWSVHADVGTMINVAKEGPKFGFTKTDTSGKIAGYIDLSYLAAATGMSADALAKFAR
jgi:ABC-type nitrate/sulfonate/bicarbonate transport system substrate-binding protein